MIYANENGLDAPAEAGKGFSAQTDRAANIVPLAAKTAAKS
jgi:hypothetical protein